LSVGNALAATVGFIFCGCSSHGSGCRDAGGL
jgi:hypothetical protein